MKGEYTLRVKKERFAILRAELDFLEETRLKLTQEYLELKEQITDAEAETRLTPEYILTQPHTAFDSKKTYRRLKEYMGQFHQISVEGYFPETGRQALKIRALRSKKVEHLIGEIKSFLPYLCEITIKKLSDYKGIEYLDDFKAKHITISEPSCSLHGIYSLLVTPTVIYLIKTTYGRSSILETFATIEDACQNIHKGKLCNKY